MLNRTYAVVHDRVVEAARQVLFDPAESDVRANFYGRDEHGVRGHYPDLVAYARGTERVQAVAEIETPESVSLDELGQWQALAGLKDEAALLVVPYSHLAETNELLAGARLYGRLQVISYVVMGPVVYFQAQ